MIDIFQIGTTNQLYSTWYYLGNSNWMGTLVCYLFSGKARQIETSNGMMMAHLSFFWGDGSASDKLMLSLIQAHAGWKQFCIKRLLCMLLIFWCVCVNLAYCGMLLVCHWMFLRHCSHKAVGLRGLSLRLWELAEGYGSFAAAGWAGNSGTGPGERVRFLLDMGC